MVAIPYLNIITHSIYRDFGHGSVKTKPPSVLSVTTSVRLVEFTTCQSHLTRYLYHPEILFHLEG